MIEKFKNIFKGLERAHGCTKVGPANNNGEKVKGQSFVVREPVTDELWTKHLQMIICNLKATHKLKNAARNTKKINGFQVSQNTEVFS